MYNLETSSLTSLQRGLPDADLGIESLKKTPPRSLQCSAIFAKNDENQQIDIVIKMLEFTLSIR